MTEVPADGGASGPRTFRAFAARAFPALGLHPPKHQKSLIQRRVARRMSALRITTWQGYAELLERDPEEAARLLGLLTVTISRYFRDRDVFEALAREVLPAILARAGAHPARGDPLRVWSAGCASGEEPYSLAMAWELWAPRAGTSRKPVAALRILATDLDAAALERARWGIASDSSLKEVPEEARERFFRRAPEGWEVLETIRAGVRLRRHDLARDRPLAPDGSPAPAGTPDLFDLVLCRNSAFTYLARPLRGPTLERLAALLAPGGALAIGAKESLPVGWERLFEPARSAAGALLPRIFQRKS